LRFSKNSLVYSTIMLMGVGVVSQLMGFIFRIILGRLIGAENMGLYQLVMPAYAIIMSLSLIGINVAVSRLTAEYHALNRHRALIQLRKMSLLRFLGLLLPVGTVVLYFSDFISASLLGDERTKLALMLVVPCILLTGIENIQKSSFYGIGNVLPPSIVELVEQFIRYASIILLILFLPSSGGGQTVGYIIIGMLIAEVFSFSAITVLWRKKFARRVAEDLPEPDMAKRIWKIAVPVGLTSLIGNLMASANSILIPQRLISSGMGAAEAMSSFGAMFGMALPMVMTPFFLINAMYIVLVPRMAESHVLKKTDEINRRTRKAMEAASTLMLPVLTFLVVTGPMLGNLLFQEKAAGEHLLPLAAGVFLICQSTILTGVLNGIGCEKFTAGVSIFCGALQLVFTYVGTGMPGVGMGGFLWGFIISNLLSFILSLIKLREKTGLKLPIMPWLLSPLLSSALTGLYGRLLLIIFTGKGLDSGPAVALCLAFSVPLYLAVMGIQGESPFSVFKESKL
jgi:stage V sporulation protein B